MILASRLQLCMLMRATGTSLLHSSLQFHKNTKISHKYSESCIYQNTHKNRDSFRRKGNTYHRAKALPSLPRRREVVESADDASTLFLPFTTPPDISFFFFEIHTERDREKEREMCEFVSGGDVCVRI